MALSDQRQQVELLWEPQFPHPGLWGTAEFLFVPWMAFFFSPRCV